MKKLISLIFFFFVFFNLFCESFQIQNIEYNFQGRTKEKNLIRKFPIDKLKVFDNQNDLSTYINSIKIDLLNTRIFENIEIYDSSINAIDPNSETATSDLLTLLDSMNTTFSQMAPLEVPEGFPGVEQLADEASQYMSDAVACYHQAYDNEYDAVMDAFSKEENINE